MPNPWQAAADILAGGGLEAIARSYLAAEGSETVRQTVFQKYPQLPIGAKNYLVGLTNAFLGAGTEQQALGAGATVPNSDIPVNPGLGGVATAATRYVYSTYVGVQSSAGAQAKDIQVDVRSPVELTSDKIAQNAESQLAAWAVKYPRLQKYLDEHPVSTGVTVIGIARAF